MDKERMYEVLEQFLDAAKISKRQFAIKCGIKPVTFQAMMTRKSDMKAETVNKIQKVMDEMTFPEEGDLIYTSDRMVYLYFEFVHAVNSVWTAAVHAHDSEVLDLLKKRLNKTGEFFYIKENEEDEEEKKDEEYENKRKEIMNISRLTSAYDKLNQDGEEKVIEYAEDLAENPRYQKKDGE